MKLPRRTFLSMAGAAAAAPAFSRFACALDYPTRPITIIVPFPAGGPVDTLARLLAEPMRQTLGQPLVIEEVFFAYTFLQENAQIQPQAEIMGGAIPLSEDEARDCAAGTFNSRLFALLWTSHENKVRLG
jgi:hypothetical protein